jgi:hypothetical protein
MLRMRSAPPRPDQVVAVPGVEIVVAVGADQDGIGVCLEDGRILDRGELVAAGCAGVRATGQAQVGADRGVELAPGDLVPAWAAVVDVVVARGAVLAHPIAALAAMHLVAPGPGGDEPGSAAREHEVVALVGVDIGTEGERTAQLRAAVCHDPVVARARQQNRHLGVAQVDVDVGGLARRGLLGGVQVDADAVRGAAEAPGVVAGAPPDIEPVRARSHERLDVDLVAVAGLVHLAGSERAAAKVDREIALAARVVRMGNHVGIQNGGLAAAAAHGGVVVLDDDVVAAANDRGAVDRLTALDRERAAGGEAAGDVCVGGVDAAREVERAGDEEAGSDAADAARGSERADVEASHMAIVGAARSAENPP